MIEKMEFVSITGPKEDIDRVVDQYLSKYEIHLENALTELQSVQYLSPYLEVNPYKSQLAKVTEFQNLLDPDTIQEDVSVSLEEALDLIDHFDTDLAQLTEKKQGLEKEKERLDLLIQQQEPLRQLDFDTAQLLKLNYIKFRFGRIAKDYFTKFKSYIYENVETLFLKCYENEHYIYGLYFCPRGMKDKIDAVYSSMHFERIHVPEEILGHAKRVYNSLVEQKNSTVQELQAVQKEIQQLISRDASRLHAAKKRLDAHSRNFDVRKLAACTKQSRREVFYILCGWMSPDDSAAFQKEIAGDKNIYCVVEHEDTANRSEPPTKLRNPKFFRPFEMYVKMYGLPAYHEIDPTIFLALTYVFIFGAMFGDVGQGLCLVIGGYLLYHFKKMDLAAIIGTAGIFSTFFGFMFGSFFGFEDVLPALWLKPISHMATLPFLGKINTVFVVAVAFGMGLLLITMILNVINAIRCKDTEALFFNQNSIAGLVFYGAIVATVVLFMTGHRLPAGIVLAVMFGIPLLIIFLKEALTRLVKKETPVIEGGKGMFFVQSFFELFDVLLSYFSNTVSFVRIGAFAVSHAAMMEVVLMLAGAEAGSPNWVIIVLGNIFVCAMEGLIVGIQVLRLEYYELFSRFYKGTGKAFKAFGHNEN